MVRIAKQKEKSRRNNYYEPKGKRKKRVGRKRKFYANSSGGVVLNNDNEESRKMVEQCYQRNKVVINPIIDWTDEEVWEFIHEYDIPYCELYDKGYKRLGCIGCPMGTRQSEELEKYPKYKQAYIHAFDRMLNNLDGSQEWKNGEDVYNWWIQK